MQDTTKLPAESNATPRPETTPSPDASDLPPRPPGAGQPPMRLLLPPPAQPVSLESAPAQGAANSHASSVIRSPLPVQSLRPLAAEKPLTAEDITHGGLLGEVVVLSPEKQATLMECETAIQSACDSLIEMGVALARIRDEKLYEAEYGSFEVYCRERWGFQHAQIYRLMAVSEMHKVLSGHPDFPAPRLESHVRPLLGLPPKVAQTAWQFALAHRGNGPLTEKVVRRAVQQLGYGPAPLAKDGTRSNRREQVAEGFKDLLKLVGERAATGIIIEKIQSLSQLVESLWVSPGKQRVRCKPQ